MSIEKAIERQAAALEKIAEVLDQRLVILEQSVSPPGEVTKAPEEVVAQPQTVDLTANTPAPQPETVVPVNDIESIAPAAGVTKRTLWDTLQDTYNTLAAVNRGPEIGELLARYQAMHIDQLSPAHYVEVHQGLIALKESVGGVNG